MISTSNPITKPFSPTDIALPKIEPTTKLGDNLALFVDRSTDILRFDIFLEAGSAYQPQKFVASSACNLFAQASRSMNAIQMAEFLDYRGILLDCHTDTFTSLITAYTTKRYADELIPVLFELLNHPLFDHRDIEMYIANKKQALEKSLLRTSTVARMLFYEALFGKKNPLGTHGTPADFSLLNDKVIVDFFNQRYHAGHLEAVITGNIASTTAELFANELSQANACEPNYTYNIIDANTLRALPLPEPTSMHHHLPGSVQSTIRIGRVLPFDCNHPHSALFTILSTALGGYFGSRLMANLREDKGYTYDIYSQVLNLRGYVMFFIYADVDADHTNDAINEINKELNRLVDEPMSKEELSTVISYISGELLRTVDGCYERTELYLQQLSAQTPLSAMDDLLAAMRTTTPDELQAIAKQYIQPDMLTTVVVGP